MSLSNGDGTGYSLSLNDNGNIIAYGSPYSDDQRGHVTVYKFIRDTWIQLGDDIKGQELGVNHGFSIDLNGDGDIIAIGSPSLTKQTNSYVKIYILKDNKWISLGNDIRYGYNSIGWNVSLNGKGNIIAISEVDPPTSLEDTIGENIVDVRLYKYTDGDWVNLRNFQSFPTSGLSLNHKGNVVAFMSTIIGNIVVYKQSSSGWDIMGNIISPEVSKLDEIGFG